MTEIFWNPARESKPSVASTHDRARLFHRHLPGYSPTPLHSLGGLAEHLNLGHLWAKDETSRLGLPSFKVLGASWAVCRALCQRLGSEPAGHDLEGLRLAAAALGPFTLVAATDGNHGRAVAHMARLLGMQARILVPDGTVAARIEGIASEGAEVIVVDGSYDDAIERSAEMAGPRAAVISDTSWEGYGDVPGWVIEGYSTIFAEIDDQLGDATVDVVAVQVGVGALAAAVIAHYGHRATVVAVEPATAACAMASARAGTPREVPGPHRSIMAGLNCGNVSVLAWPALHTGVDVFVAVDDEAAEHAMRQLAGAGLAVGESGAAGLAGLNELVAVAGPRAALGGASALVLCTEGVTDPAGYARITGAAG